MSGRDWIEIAILMWVAAASARVLCTFLPPVLADIEWLLSNRKG